MQSVLYFFSIVALIFAIISLVFILNVTVKEAVNIKEEQYSITFLNSDFVDVNCDGFIDSLFEENHEIHVLLGKQNSKGQLQFDNIDYNFEIPFDSVSKIDFFDFDGDNCGDLILIDNESIATVFINKSNNTDFIFEESMYKKDS